MNRATPAGPMCRDDLRTRGPSGAAHRGPAARPRLLRGALRLALGADRHWLWLLPGPRPGPAPGRRHRRMPDGPGPVLPYVEVDEIAAATGRARRSGAAVLLEPREGP